MTDYSARGVKIVSFIGSDENPMDITDLVQTIAPLKTSPLDLLVGYVKSETSLLLVSNTPGFLETRFNPRWAIANKIEIWVANSTGTLILHKTLRILDNYFDDGVGEGAKVPGSDSLELELGDLFALKDRRYPNPGDIDIPVLENAIDVPILTTCNYWLQIFGLPQVTIAPGDEAPTERITTTGLYGANSGILEHIGKILSTNTRFVFWLDSQERVRVRRVGLPPENNAYLWQTNSQRVQYYKVFDTELVDTLGDSAIAYSFAPDDLLINKRAASEREQVAGTVQVAGVSLYRYPYSDPAPSTESTNEGGVSTSETLTVSTTANTRTTTRSGTVAIAGLQSGTDQPDPGNIGSFEEITVENFGGAIGSVPNSNPVLPPYPGLSAYLLSQDYTLREQRLAPGTNTLQAIAITKQVSTAYKYRNTTALLQGVLIRGVEIEEIQEVTKILAVGGSALKVDTVRRQSWKPLREGIYHFTETILRPGDIENRRTSTISNSVGESSPPATKWAPQTIVNEQREIYAMALFNYPPDMPDNDHPRSYNCGAYLDSNRAAKFLAEALGALLIGRNEAQNLGFRPTDAWLADPVPCPWVAVERNSAEQDLYLLDTPIMVFDKRRSYLGGSGVYCGRRDRATGKITLPYELGLEIWAYDFNSPVVDELAIPVRI